MLAKSISALEDGVRPGPLRITRKRHTRKRSTFVIGITGSQGSGKSTLIEALAKNIRADGRTVAVLAVDPTSPRTGGAFLGDRMRMQSLAEDPGVFIRSMASRGAKGGVAKATEKAAELCARAGFDFVLIETVGAGQLDYEVTRFADVTVLLLTPEAGDQMQFMKAGLRELADIFVVNKADRPGAQTMEDLLRRMDSGNRVFKTVAEEGKGVDRVYAAIRNELDEKRK